MGRRCSLCRDMLEELGVIFKKLYNKYALKTTYEEVSKLTNNLDLVCVFL